MHQWNPCSTAVKRRQLHLVFYFPANVQKQDVSHQCTRSSLVPPCVQSSIAKKKAPRLVQPKRTPSPPLSIKDHTGYVGSYASTCKFSPARTVSSYASKAIALKIMSKVPVKVGELLHFQVPFLQPPRSTHTIYRFTAKSFFIVTRVLCPHTVNSCQAK